MNECEKVLVLINDPVQAQELADKLYVSGIKIQNYPSATNALNFDRTL